MKLKDEKFGCWTVNHNEKMETAEYGIFVAGDIVLRTSDGV